MKRLEERIEIELTAQAEADLIEIGDLIAKDNPSPRFKWPLTDRHPTLLEQSVEISTVIRHRNGRI
jgi:hypothetical protein